MVNFWKRPRTLVLSALMLVAAWLIWRQSREQATAGRQAVAQWVEDAVHSAAATRDAPLALGGTEPVVADALAAWVRSAQPANVLGDPTIEVAVIPKDMFGGSSGAATHRVTVQLRGQQATLLVEWDGTRARGVGFERGAGLERGAAQPGG